MDNDDLDSAGQSDTGVDDAALIDAARREAEALGQASTVRPALPSPGESGLCGAPALQPDSVAGYQILKEIHCGGQGVVYQALQKSTKRKVALKVMKEGPFATPAEEARFEREVQILGQLNHPNIVAIHDSGQAAGCHYFVMDYISGQPLDVWMVGAAHSNVDTLKLFAKICDAVNAAHLRGITHRDLKPGNIRVDENDEPHVLDFGLAKVAHSPDEASLMTLTGQFMGSLPWASPEQAEGVPGKVDIRTDVYSLGVILYQMLTGRFPYEVIGNMRDVLDRIMRTEPARPSTVRRQINDEVETIVLKCLQKERERRYQSAGELARDIGRYLAGEPIEAKRDSGMYVLRKALRRYRGTIAVTVSFAVLIMVALVAVSALYVRAERAKRAETAQRTEAEQNARAARDEREQAIRQAYVANVSAADALIRGGDVVAAKTRLDACTASLRGWEWRYLDAHIDTSLATLRGHSGAVNSVAFSPDGTRALTGSSDRTAKIWDTATGQELLTFGGHGDKVWTARFSSDGTRVLTGSADGSARIWDSQTGQELRTLRGQGPGVAFSPDGTRVATISGSCDGSASIWDVQTGREVLRVCEHESWVSDAQFSPDGKELVTSANDGTAKIWDVPSGLPLMTLRGHTGCVNCAVFSPDGTRVATAARDKTARIWDATTGQMLLILRGHSVSINSVAFNPAGTQVVTGSWDNTAKLWDAQTGQELLTFRGHTNLADGIGQVAFSPDGGSVLTAGFDGTAKLWDAKADQEVLTFRGHTHFVTCATLSRDGTRLVTGSMDNTVRLWDAQTGRELLRLAGGYPGHAAALSPDGRQIVMSAGTAASPRVAVIYDTRTGRELATLRGHSRNINSTAFSPDGAVVLTASDDFTVRLWDTQNGQELRSFHGHSGPVNCAAFSPDGPRVATASDDLTARIWNAHTGAELHVLTGHTAPVMSAAFSPDGERVVTASWDHTAKVWDSRTGQELLTLRGHGGLVLSAVFNPEGTRVVTGSRDRTAKVWDADTGQELLTLRGHAYHVSSVAFSRDGTRLVTASWDGTVKIWDSVRWADRLREQAASAATLSPALP